jgi:hypothetical protein
MTERSHLFPYRTQKLSSPVLMVLGPQGPGRVSRRRVIKKRTTEMLFFFLLPVDAKLCFAHRHIKEAFPYGNP